MESNMPQSTKQFENIFITTIKTDSPSLNWKCIQKEAVSCVVEQTRERRNGESVSQSELSSVVCTSAPVVQHPRDAVLLQSDNNVTCEKTDEITNAACVTTKQHVTFSHDEVLADLTFCVPKTVIEAQQKLNDCEKDLATTKPNSTKTRILKIYKRLTQQKHSKASLKKQWKKREQRFKRMGDNLSERKTNESTALPCVIEAHTEWLSPQLMRDAFDKVCQVCYSYHKENNTDGACPLLNPAAVVNHDSESKLGYELPRDIFLGYSRVYEDRLSLFVRNDTPKLTQFGPLKGQRLGLTELAKLCLPEIDLDHIWPVKKTDKPHDHLTIDEYIDTKDESSSNWLRFLLPEHSSALTRDKFSPLKANVQRVLKDDNIYFVTIRDIKMGEELFLRCMEPPERIYFNLTAMASSSGSQLNKTKLRALLDDCTTCKGKLREKFPFSSILRMVRHRRMMHNTLPAMCDYANIFHCNFCGAEFRFQTELRKHRSDTHLIHDQQHNTQCQYCKIYKKSVDALSGHVSAVHFVNSNHPVTCTLCGLQFPTHGRYQQHRVNDHRPQQTDGGNLSNVCNLCGKSFKTYSTLRKHVWKVHEKKDYRVCETCGKSFKDRYQLKVHSLTHSGIKPFQCDMHGCSAAFTTKQWLQKHYLTAHNLTRESMPQIQRKIDFDNIFSAKINGQNGQIQKPITIRKDKQPSVTSSLQSDMDKKNGNELEPTTRILESISSHFVAPNEQHQSTIQLIHDNIDLSPSASNLSNGGMTVNISSQTQDFSTINSRDILSMASQNCVPVSHFAALSHGMAIQNSLAVQVPARALAPPAPLLQPSFDDQQVAPGGRWIANEHTGVQNAMQQLQGVFDSAYYTMPDFY